MLKPTHSKMSSGSMKTFIPGVNDGERDHYLGGRGWGHDTYTGARAIAKTAIGIIEKGEATLADFDSGTIEPYLARELGRLMLNFWILVYAESRVPLTVQNPYDPEDTRHYLDGFYSEKRALAALQESWPEDKGLIIHKTTARITVDYCRAAEEPTGLLLTYPGDITAVFSF